MEEERMDQNLKSAEVSASSKFVREWLPFVLVIGGAFLMVALGQMAGEQREQARLNAPPDEVKTYSQCKVLDKGMVSVELVMYYVQTSCGNFLTSRGKLVEELKKGEIYDFTFIESYGADKSITAVKVSP